MNSYSLFVENFQLGEMAKVESTLESEISRKDESMDSALEHYCYDPSDVSQQETDFIELHEECLTEVNFLKRKIEEVEKENSTLREELHSSESYKSLLEVKISKCTKHLAKLEKVCAELNRAREEGIEKIGDLFEEVKNCRIELASKRRENKELEERVSILEADEEEARSLSEKLFNLSKSYNQINTERIKYQDEYEAKSSECETIRRDMSLLMESHVKLENSLTETIDIYEMKLREKDDEICSLQEISPSIFLSDDEILKRKVFTNDIGGHSTSTPCKNFSEEDVTKNLYDELSETDPRHFNYQKYSIVENELRQTADEVQRVVSEIALKDPKRSLSPISIENFDDVSEIDRLRHSISKLVSWTKPTPTTEQETQTEDENANITVSKSIFTLPTQDKKNDSSSVLDTPLRSSFYLPSKKGDENDNLVLESSDESKRDATPISDVPHVPALKPRRKPSVYSSSFDVQDRQVVRKRTGDDDLLTGRYRSPKGYSSSNSSTDASPAKLDLETSLDESSEIRSDSETSFGINQIYMAPSKLIGGKGTIIKSSRVSEIKLEEVRNRFKNVTIRRHDERITRFSDGFIASYNSSDSEPQTPKDVSKIETTDSPTCDNHDETASTSRATVTRAMPSCERDGSAERAASHRQIGDHDRRAHLMKMKRSASDSDLRAKIEESPSEESDEKITSFPSLTNFTLGLTGIENLFSVDEEKKDVPMETELERKYTSFSIGLAADRMTLSRRAALALRQRDQAENNLSVEIQRMKQDIQDLTSFCTDKESIEKIEKARHQLQMIDKCAHNVSCTAETLGAIKQESRISKAISLSDRYLQVLRTRCNKLVDEVTETKRVLTESNVMLEENPSEIGDDVPRIRYRAVNSNSRTVESSPKQRNSICGRVSTRRPSLSYERQDGDRLDHAERTRSHDKHDILDNGNGVEELLVHRKDDEVPLVQESETSPLNESQSKWSSVYLRLNLFLVAFFMFVLIVIFLLATLYCKNGSCQWYSIEEIIGSNLNFMDDGPKAI